MATRMTITATITFEIMTSGDEELDAICDDIHDQIGMMMADNDWEGAAELSWKTVEDPDKYLTRDAHDNLSYY